MAPVAPGGSESEKHRFAKACEAFDGEIFELLGGAVSGHTIKHLLAAVSVYVVVAMLRRAPVDDEAGRAAP